MNTRFVLGASALVMALLGLAATFLPHEILQYIGAPAAGALPSIIQIVGALYLSFGMLNWTAKDSLIGGIYNRPVALGNLLHFTMGALALGKTAVAGHAPSAILPFAVGYALFAIAFALIFFTSPVKTAAAP